MWKIIYTWLLKEYYYIIVVNFGRSGSIQLVNRCNSMLNYYNFRVLRPVILP